MGTRLFVGGLSFNTDDAGLKDAFQAHGNVVEAKVILDRDTGRSRGFGFVTFATDEEAQAAVQAMNGAFVDGRTIRVNEAQERGGRPGGGPRGGGGGGYRGGGGRGGPEVVTRGRGPGPGQRPSGPPRDGGGGNWRPRGPQIPDGPDVPFENEFDDRKRRDFSKKQREKVERDFEKAAPKPPRKPNRRASGRNWRDYDMDEDEDY